MFYKALLLTLSLTATTSACDDADTSVVAQAYTEGVLITVHCSQEFGKCRVITDDHNGQVDTTFTKGADSMLTVVANVQTEPWYYTPSSGLLFIAYDLGLMDNLIDKMIRAGE